MPTVLIADDDPSLLEAVTMLLEASGYQVEATQSMAETLDRWPRTHPDLVIVDLHMPGDGMELVKTICKETSVPVIVLSGDDQEKVKVEALDAGAEDYITKSFSAAELLARIRVALRRVAKDMEVITMGPLTLSEEKRTAAAGSATVDLTPTEFDLLRTLATAKGFVATADLLNDIWGPAYRSELDYVRVYIRRVRSKVESLGLDDPIESRPGLGYRLNV